MKCKTCGYSSFTTFCPKCHPLGCTCTKCKPIIRTVEKEHDPNYNLIFTGMCRLLVEHNVEPRDKLIIDIGNMLDERLNTQPSSESKCENCVSYVTRASFCKDLDNGVADDFYCSHWMPKKEK